MDVQSHSKQLVYNTMNLVWSGSRVRHLNAVANSSRKGSHNAFPGPNAGLSVEVNLTYAYEAQASSENSISTHLPRDPRAPSPSWLH